LKGTDAQSIKSMDEEHSVKAPE